MQKHHPINKVSESEKQDFFAFFSDNSFLEWLSANGKTLIYGVIALFALIFLFFKFFSGSQAQAENDYFNAANDFALFQKLVTEDNRPEAQKILERLTTIIKRHPELHAQYDGMIAQALINEGNIIEAKRYSIPTFKRISQDKLSFYEDFANNTFLISEKKYADALSQAINLRQMMIQALDKDTGSQEEFGSMLFALNLFRIGMLQQELGNPNEELKTWQEWDHYLNAQKPISGTAFVILNQQIADGKITLADYIQQRLKSLRK